MPPKARYHPSALLDLIEHLPLQQRRQQLHPWLWPGPEVLHKEINMEDLLPTMAEDVLPVLLAMVENLKIATAHLQSPKHPLNQATTLQLMLR
jgi:hypothetical protein